MANLTDVIVTDLSNIFIIIKVGIGFAIFYFIFSHFFNDLSITNKKNKKTRSFNKNNNNEKIKSNVKVSLKK